MSFDISVIVSKPMITIVNENLLLLLVVHKQLKVIIMVRKHRKGNIFRTADYNQGPIL